MGLVHFLTSPKFELKSKVKLYVIMTSLGLENRRDFDLSPCSPSGDIVFAKALPNASPHPPPNEKFVIAMKMLQTHGTAGMDSAEI